MFFIIFQQCYLQLQHAGDLGNISADATGKATFWKIDKFLKISDIIGRSLVITENPDDLGKGDNTESKINGNSGTGYIKLLLHVKCKQLICCISNVVS
jgi:Cu/Zn superoxide dismutase